MKTLLALALLAPLAAGCSDGAASPTPTDAGAVDVPTTRDAGDDAPAANDVSVGVDTPSVADAGAPVDASPTALRRCPQTGRGALLGDHCFLLTPTETGLGPTGVNANFDHYALRPRGAARGQLMVFFNGSGGHPLGVIASPNTNLYASARDAGLHVLALSYRSDEAIATLCASSADRDACFLATRMTLMSGRFQTGASSALADITLGEGVYARLAMALRYLATRDPDGGWEQFLGDTAGEDPTRYFVWSRIVAAGHSQGSGHAALLGRLHALDRVLAFAGPCDQVQAMPAAWLRGPTAFATDPATRFVGLGHPSDAICGQYPAAWESLGLAPSARITAQLCAGVGAHGAPIECVENAPLWARMLAPR